MGQFIKYLMLLKYLSLNYMFGVLYLYLLSQTFAFAWQSSHSNSWVEMLKNSFLISYRRLCYFPHTMTGKIPGDDRQTTDSSCCHSKATTWMRTSGRVHLGPKPFTSTGINPKRLPPLVLLQYGSTGGSPLRFTSQAHPTRVLCDFFKTLLIWHSYSSSVSLFGSCSTQSN